MTEGLEIIEVTGRRLFDSEGLPAVEAEVELENGARGRAMVALCEKQREHGSDDGGAVRVRTV